jgi:hypothetical protein
MILILIQICHLHTQFIRTFQISLNLRWLRHLRLDPVVLYVLQNLTLQFATLKDHRTLQLAICKDRRNTPRPNQLALLPPSPLLGSVHLSRLSMNLIIHPTQRRRSKRQPTKLPLRWTNFYHSQPQLINQWNLKSIALKHVSSSKSLNSTEG